MDTKLRKCAYHQPKSKAGEVSYGIDDGPCNEKETGGSQCQTRDRAYVTPLSSKWIPCTEYSVLFPAP